MKYIAIFLVFLIFSCRSEKIKIPVNVIEKDKMVEILSDVHLSEVLTVKEKIADVKISNQLKLHYFNTILEKHQISKTEYETAMNFYKENPQLLFDIYETVMENLNKMEVDITQEEDIEDSKTETKENKEEIKKKEQ